MAHLNVEIKARAGQPERVRAELLRRGARFAGIDRQTDTYFHVPDGRLKLREGTIENSLIFYERADTAGPKASQVRLCPLEPGNSAEVPAGPRSQTPRTSSLREVLQAALGTFRIVEKVREIYFIDNVKFHIDEVPGLGSFVEIEAIDLDGRADESSLRAQCVDYIAVLGIAAEELEARSYSDLLADRHQPRVPHRCT